MEDAGKGGNATFTVDLEAQEIARPDGEKIAFEVDPFRKHCLLNGLDDIGLTLERGGKIDGYEGTQRGGQPWLWSGATPA
ncbi:MAG: 3-isopropylmalate dehydratase small subunit, partial [Rhodospirillaceae bacterium]|nr:3-isopropylmalate dehydratase small subunit [Rhodospirillaceae bacterium]